MWVRSPPYPHIGALPLPSQRAVSSTVATLQGLPAGEAATVETLKKMRDLVRAAVRSTDQKIRELALEIVRTLPARGWAKEIVALHAFVRDRIRYVRDPEDLELVQSPEKTLEYGQGDCDDKCTLLAALLTATGHPSRFVALGFRGEPFSHVIVETKHNLRWLALETIIPKPAGWTPPDASSRYILKV